MIISNKKDIAFSYRKEKSELEKIVGLVPTMGALHEGHLSLVEKAKEQCDIVIVTIFVNPLQFNKESDFNSYPLNLEKDVSLLEKRGVDFVFAPKKEEFFPENFIPRRFPIEKLEKVMEGEQRQGHFQGVCNILSLFFELFSPQKVFFGEKDYQQILVVKKLIELEKFSIELVMCETVREKNGLAMSSRNLLLSKKEKEKCGKISESLSFIKEQLKKVENLETLLSEQKQKLFSQGFQVEYLEIYDSETIEKVSELKNITSNCRLFCAAYFKGVRLIDNVPLCSIF